MGVGRGREREGGREMRVGRGRSSIALGILIGSRKKKKEEEGLIWYFSYLENIARLQRLPGMEYMYEMISYTRTHIDAHTRTHAHTHTHSLSFSIYLLCLSVSFFHCIFLYRFSKSLFLLISSLLPSSPWPKNWWDSASGKPQWGWQVSPKAVAHV